MTRVCIIGGAGFIGNHLTESLLKNSRYEIDIVDNFSRFSEQGSERLSSPNITYIEMDIANSFDPSRLSDYYEQTYLLASVVGVDYVLEHPTFVLSENMRIINNVFSWLKTGPTKRILFTSTSEVYAGAVEEDIATVPTPEDVPVVVQDIKHPRFTYAITKAYGESLFLNGSNEFEFEACVVRYHNVYGTNMGNRHVLPHLFDRFQEEDPFTIYGGPQTRSFNHVSDAVAGTELVMNKGSSGQIYHIGTDTETTIEELTRFVGAELGFSGQFIEAEAYPGSVKRRCPDISKIAALGYKAKVHWKDGVRDYLESRQSN